MSARTRPRALFVVPLLICLCGAASSDDDFGKIADFALTERSGRIVHQSDLLGKVWIASFVFTRCTAGCPQISTTMKQLQDDFASDPDVRLVSFTVDPKNDEPDKLRTYAQHFGADPERWLFLTGEEDEIYRLLENSFRLPAEKNTGENYKPGNEVAHSSKLVVVDRNGHIRGYYDGMPDPNANDDSAYRASLRKLKAKVTSLEHDAWYLPRDFPRFNATLNAITACLLVLGYAAIRRRLIRLHVACMVLALGLSTIFLISYVYHHAVIKRGLTTSFASQTNHVQPPPSAWVNVAYQTVLWTHTPLAALVVPLAIVTAYRGVTRQWKRHAALARWTLPIWLYVAITGVVVYWMLYRLYPLP